MTTTPVQPDVTDSHTGEVKQSGTMDFEIMPAPEGTCPECATEHDFDDPHNAMSMHYQYTFFAREGRWPTWKDAMSHLRAEIQEQWIDGLKRAGVDVEAGQIAPQPTSDASTAKE